MPLPASSLSMVGLPLPGEPMYKKPRQAMIIRMSAETFDALDDPQNDRKLEVEFGDSPGLHIGGQFFPVQHTPENANHELYIRLLQANKPAAPLKLYANVIGKFMVERQLGEKVQETVRDRTKQAEEARTERKTIYLEKPPVLPKPSRPKKKEIARRAPPASTTYAVSKAPAAAPPKVPPHAAPSGPSSKTSPPHSSSLAAGPSKATAAAASSMTSPLHPSTSYTVGAAGEVTLPSGTRSRLIHCLALKPRTQESVIAMVLGKDAPSRQKNELMVLLHTAAEPVPVAKNSDPSIPQRWQLKLDSWREVRPYEWPNLTDEERTHLARQARTAYKDLRIPQDDPIWEFARYQPASGPSGSTTANARAPGEKNGVVMTKKTKAAGEGARNRKQVSDIMIPAKDESSNSKGKVRDLDESSAAGTPTSATRPPVRRQPGSGYKVAKHSATPPVTDVRANSPLVPPKKLAPPDPREGRRDPAGSSASKPPPSPAEARSTAAAAQIRKKAKDSQAAPNGRSAEERREDRIREREREREKERDKEKEKEKGDDKPRVKAAASPVPPPLPSFKRKKPAQDGNDSEYSEREVPLSASTSKKRKLEEAQPSSSDKARARDRDLSLPKKPINVKREPSPLSAPRLKIKKEASPLSTALSPPRSASARPSLPPRPPTAANKAHNSTSSSSSSSAKDTKPAEPVRSGKSRRKSPIYTSSEDESERSVPAVRERPAPEAHSPPEDPPPKRFKATHTQRFKPRPLPKDSAGLRKYYDGCWQIYDQMHKSHVERRGQLERLLKKEERGGYAPASDEDMDMSELEPDVLAVFMEDLNAVTDELQKVRQAYETLGNQKRDSLGELVDVC